MERRPNATVIMDRATKKGSLSSGRRPARGGRSWTLWLLSGGLLAGASLLPDLIQLSESRLLPSAGAQALFLGAGFASYAFLGGAAALAVLALGRLLRLRSVWAGRLMLWLAAAALLLPQAILFDHYRITGFAPFTGGRLGSSHTLLIALVGLPVAAVWAALWRIVARRIDRGLRAGVVVFAFIVCGAAGLASFRQVTHEPDVRRIVFDRTTLTGRMLGKIDIWWDRDGDTFAPAWLGGGDSDDGDPATHPLAAWDRAGGEGTAAGEGTGEPVIGRARAREAPGMEGETAAGDSLWGSFHLEGVPENLNILLITDDTLRPDHLGCYGYPFDTSPNIDKLAGGGVIFQRCIVPQPKTSPSLASLLTAKHPHKHNVRLIGQKLQDSHLTAAEILSVYGYFTCGLTRNGVVSATFGFDQGFHNYRHVSGPLESAATDSALVWLERHQAGDLVHPARGTGSAGSPFFLWIHYLDPHGPYNRPAAYTRAPREELTERLLENRYPATVSRWRIPPYQRLGTQEVAEYIHSYNGEITAIDAEVGRLLDWLDARDLADSTLVIFSSDHGESFTEHDYYFEHGEVPYDDNAHVPLIFRLPGSLPAGKVIGVQVRTTDVLPTLLDMLEIPPLPGPEGESLLGLLLDREPPRDRPVYILANYISSYSPRYFTNAVTDGRWKIVYTPEFHILELYDLRSDPRELTNLWGRWETDPDLSAARDAGLRLREDLARRMRAARAGRRREAPKVTEMTQDLMEQLRSLGYIN
ncbi:MAG: sulfatase-like hydrolase/transferase [Candidatus Eisenbacteria bacterium]|nr:sulfatase-like hydrolase/transferase [Candidatus Eisenbacteria bacterium]